MCVIVVELMKILMNTGNKDIYGKGPIQLKIEEINRQILSGVDFGTKEWTGFDIVCLSCFEHNIKGRHYCKGYKIIYFFIRRVICQIKKSLQKHY